MDGNPFSTNYPAAWGGQAPGAGGFDWSSLLQNKAFLSMISQVGAGIAGDNPAVQGINQLNQNMIGSKSMAGLMQKFLAGQVPGGKIQIDDQGFKLSGPQSALGDLSGPMGSGLQLAQQGSQLPGGSGTNWTPQNAPDIGRQTNPFVSSQPGALSYADLAGLTPQDVLQAMQVASNAIYQSNISQTQRTQADTQRLAEWRRIKEIPDKVQVEVKKGEFLEVDPKNALDYYAKINDMPTSYDTYKIAKGDPEFKSYLLEMAKAGKTEINIGETVAKTKAVGKAKQELDVTSPTYVRDTISPLKKDTYNWRKSIAPYESTWESRGVTDPAEKRRLAELSYTIDTITYDLRRAFGKSDLEPVIEEETDDIVWIVDGEVVQRISQ